MKNVNEQKYLGFVLSADGSNMKNIQEKQKRAIGIRKDITFKILLLVKNCKAYPELLVLFSSRSLALKSLSKNLLFKNGAWVKSSSFEWKLYHFEQNKMIFNDDFRTRGKKNHKFRAPDLSRIDWFSIAVFTFQTCAFCIPSLRINRVLWLACIK